MSDSIQINNPWPDELKFVDEDIKNEFEGKTYYFGTPINLQLSRDIRNCTEQMKLLMELINHCLRKLDE